MRIDNKLKKIPLSPEQYFFASCWYNMVHAYSLDSYRVRAINPANGLRELQRMMAPHANSEDFSMVSAELCGLLSADPVLAHPPFRQARDELLDLLADATSKDPKKIEPKKPLVQAFSRELLGIVEEHYVPATFKALEYCLITNPDEIPAVDRNAHIQVLTGNLLSTLLDKGGSIESLYQLYRQVICDIKANKAYVFSKKLGLLIRLITQPTRQFAVIFAIDNISNVENFPEKMGNVSFCCAPPDVNEANAHAQKYLKGHPKRLFAQVSVETVDYRDAGSAAYEQINNILDLVRFEYERERLHVPDEFAISLADQANYRLFPIPKVVPNPDASVDTDGLQGFVISVNELMGNPGLQEDERSRVQSAFRLYRVGADANIFENKLISWWTAIEYLVKGSTSSGKIGSAVEKTLTPVLCLRYIDKLLVSFRNALVDQKAVIKDVATSEAIHLKELGPLALYELFKNSAYQDQLLAASPDPFMKQKLGDFLQSLSTPQATRAMLKAHEQRLRWHIQRLYRARCDIVHSAERLVNAALLCANLEFYLKTTLTALLRAFRTVPHISGPREFFDRQVHAHTKLLDSLSKGNDDRLTALLAN